MPLYVVLILIVLIAVYSIAHVVYREYIIEKPSYEVLEKKNGYEIREYKNILVAKVEVDSDDRDAMNSGFMEVADFIFGNNDTGNGSEKIAMTSPVLDERTSDGKRIISFVMPSKWTQETLPRPNNDKIEIELFESKTYAVKKFTGGWDQATIDKKLEELKAGLKTDKIPYTSNTIFAYYDPPSAPAFVRRVDIMVELNVYEPEEVVIPEDAAVATFAGGCFWCMEPAFEEMDGVYAAISGYAGGDESEASYKLVASGDTNHREAVQVHYDSTKVSYDELLEVYWRQIDPTDDGGQFADRGYHYTTAIYYNNDEEKAAAEKSKQDLAESEKFDKPIATEVIPFETFFPAEEEHQDFYKKQSSYYKSYKKGSGRADYIEETWE